MSEALLQALMQLFALASNDDDITQESRVIVELFLQSELNQKLVEQYIQLYDHYVHEYQQSFNEESVTFEPEKVRNICLQINESLLQKQKLVVLLRLLEYIFADGNISNHELEFVTLLANTFNIPNDEFTNCLNFAQSTKDDFIENDAFLYLEEHPSGKGEHFKQLKIHHLEGKITVVSFPSVNILAFKYFGNQTLYLNGQILSPISIHLFTNGSSIRGNKIHPIYYSDVLASFMDKSLDDKIVFKVKNISYEFGNGNKGLHDFSFTEQSGRLIGIMGGSGAGKSTLLNILNGNYSPTHGAVTINDIDIHKNKKEIRGIIGYVSQDDLLIEELTVFQNLFYNAKLCFADLTDDEITDKVNKILESLGLFESKDLKVGNPIDKVISGGQRKRLNIALELIREPSVLFIDEPTSGLSSRDSENIMDLLKQLTLKGKLVFVVIHQPSSDIFKMFDKLAILDLGGYPIYYGDPVESVIYFKTQTLQVNNDESECLTCGNVNPEQVFNIIESKVVDEFGNQTFHRKKSPKEWYQKFKESSLDTNGVKYENLETPENKLKTPNKLNQFKIFTIRDVLSKLTNRQYMLINLLEAPILALILSYFIKYSAGIKGNAYSFMENENLPAYIFMAVIVVLFMGLTVSAEEIIRDQKIRKRESFLDLSKGSYLISKILILFTLSAIQSFLFVVIGNWVMEIKEMTFAYWLILFSSAAFANLLGLNISASFNSAVTIYILIPFLIIPQLIFSGVIVKFDKLNPSVSSKSHVPLIGEVMTSRWAFEAIAVTQFKDNYLNKQLFDYDKKLSAINFKKIYWLPAVQSKMNMLESLEKAGDRNQEYQQHLTLITNEINKPEFELSLPQHNFNLSGNKITLAEIDDLNAYLRQLKKILNKAYINVLDEKDMRVMDIEESNSKPEFFNYLKSSYTNTSLKDLVTNKAEFNKIIEVDGHLIQRENPIYLDASYFRAHFFAPNKFLLGSKIDTYWVNLAVIWLMNITLVILLYFDVLKRFIKSLQSLRRVKR